MESLGGYNNYGSGYDHETQLNTNLNNRRNIEDLTYEQLNNILIKKILDDNVINSSNKVLYKKKLEESSNYNYEYIKSMIKKEIRMNRNDKLKYMRMINTLIEKSETVKNEKGETVKKKLKNGLKQYEYIWINYKKSKNTYKKKNEKHIIDAKNKFDAYQQIFEKHYAIYPQNVIEFFDDYDDEIDNTDDVYNNEELLIDFIESNMNNEYDGLSVKDFKEI